MSGLTDEVEIVKDISPGQLEMMAEYEPQMAYHYFKAAKQALNDRRSELNDWDITVAENVISILQKSFSGIVDNTHEIPPIIHPEVPGYVYLIVASTGQYKIGCSFDPKKRIRSISQGVPFTLELLALIETDTMYELERELHERFQDKRIRNEWFDLTPEDVEYIKDLSS